MPIAPQRLIEAFRQSGPPEVMAHVQKYAKPVCQAYNAAEEKAVAEAESEKATTKKTGK